MTGLLSHGVVIHFAKKLEVCKHVYDVCVCVCVCVVAIIHVRNALCCVGWVHVCSYDTGVSCFNGTSYPGFIFSFHGRESG